MEAAGFSFWEGSKELSLLLVHFLRGPVSQGSCETAFSMSLHFCLEFMAISLLLNLVSLALSMFQVHFCLRILSFYQWVLPPETQVYVGISALSSVETLGS